jgi:hypothetical protein
MTKFPYLSGAAILTCGVAVLAPGAGDDWPMPDLDGGSPGSTLLS